MSDSGVMKLKSSVLRKIQIEFCKSKKYLVMNSIEASLELSLVLGSAGLLDDVSCFPIHAIQMSPVEVLFFPVLRCALV